jgi:hypothetical protein
MIFIHQLLFSLELYVFKACTILLKPHILIRICLDRIKICRFKLNFQIVKILDTIGYLKIFFFDIDILLESNFLIKKGDKN